MERFWVVYWIPKANSEQNNLNFGHYSDVSILMCHDLKPQKCIQTEIN